MSSKQVKRMRRIARKQTERSQKRLIQEFLRTVCMFSLKGRVRLALMIVFKRIGGAR